MKCLPGKNIHKQQLLDGDCGRGGLKPYFFSTQVFIMETS